MKVLLDAVVHEAMCDDVHGTNLQATSFTDVIAKIKEAGRPCTLVLGDGNPDPPTYARLHAAYRPVFDKFATYNPEARAYNKAWEGVKGRYFDKEAV